MALGQTRNSVMAVMVESVEGTPVAPSGATSFIALQPDTGMNPAFDSLQNEELRGSIGQAKAIQGIERPEGGFPHYLKHSGTEGEAPEIHELLKAAFGSATVNSTERTTTTSSTVSVLKLGAGGSDFSRGFAGLIKDGTNGYSIRPFHSVSSNDITLGFNLANAPATGVNIGKCINYSPTNTGHQSLSFHRYDGNGHLYQLIAGGKVTEFNFTAPAGEFVNANFSYAGTKYFFNPIYIAATDTKLDFNDGSDDFAATVTAKWYRDPHELAQAIQDSMNAQGAADEYTVTFDDSTGKFTIVTDGSTLSLLWNTGSNTSNTIGDKIGFSVAADDTSATTYTSDNALSYAAPYTPTYDSSDPLAAKNHEVLLGDADDNATMDPRSVTFTMSNERTEVTSVAAESGIYSNIFTGRTVTVSIQALIQKHDADKFRRFRENEETRFCYNFGSKSGGNWVAGKCGCLYIPTCTISSFQVVDLDRVIGIDMELTAFVDSSGNGEVYLNFL